MRLPDGIFPGQQMVLPILNGGGGGGGGGGGAAAAAAATVSLPLPLCHPRAFLWIVRHTQRVHTGQPVPSTRKAS